MSAITLHTGEKIEVDRSDDGIDLIGTGDLADGHLALTWGDVAELVIALSDALKERMQLEVIR